jgi:hypothetical protein
MSNRPHFLTSMSGVISAFQRHIARHLTPYGRKYRPFQPGEVAEYIGRSVVIIVLFIILHTLTCAGTFTYTLWYTSTKKKFLSAQDMRPYTRYVHLRSTTCVVLEPLEAPHVPSKRTSSLRPGLISGRMRPVRAIRTVAHVFLCGYGQPAVLSLHIGFGCV